MQYPDAKHQNMAGVTHPVAFVQELLHKVKQANANSPLESSTDISQAMRDALSPDGPSPAITFGDNIHWRVMLISARRKHVDFVDPFGTGFLRSVKTSVQEFYQRDNTGHGHSQSGPKGYSLEGTPGTMEYGQYGSRKSGCNTGVKQKQQRHLLVGWNMTST